MSKKRLTKQQIQKRLSVIPAKYLRAYLTYLFAFVFEAKRTSDRLENLEITWAADLIEDVKGIDKKLTDNGSQIEDLFSRLKTLSREEKKQCRKFAVIMKRRDSIKKHIFYIGELPHIKKLAK